MARGRKGQERRVLGVTREMGFSSWGHTGQVGGLQKNCYLKEAIGRQHHGDAKELCAFCLELCLLHMLEAK